jgi:hypothetical protein
MAGMAFDREVGEDVARARRHSVGDLLRRTARRFPGRLAVVGGGRRFTFAGVVLVPQFQPAPTITDVHTPRTPPRRAGAKSR